MLKSDEDEPIEAFANKVEIERILMDLLNVHHVREYQSKSIDKAIHDIDIVYEATARFENMRIGQEQVRIGAAQLGEFKSAAHEQHEDLQELIKTIRGDRFSGTNSMRVVK